MTSGSGGADNHCGYEWDPEWLDNPEVEMNFQHCCARETWGDENRCWWHMKRDKSISELRRAAADHGCSMEQVPGARLETEQNRKLNRRAPGGSDELAPQPAELLCGIHAPGVEFRNTFDWTGVWLNDGDLSGANLADADLRWIDAERVAMADTVLQGADLTNADLRVDASGADLRGATLADASACVVDKVFASLPRPDFSDTHLANADLSGANFSGADLTDARLTSADLRDANLEMVSLERANLFDTDLSNAGLYGAVLTSTQINRDTTFFEGDEERCRYHPSDPTLGELLRGATEGADRPEQPASAAEDEHMDTTDDRFSKAAWTYRAIERLARQNSFPSMQSRMFLKRQRMQTRMHRRDKGLLSGDYLFSVISGIFIKHGEGYLRVIAWGGAIVLAFALLFPVGGWIRPIGPDGTPEDPITWSRIAEEPSLLWESVYYSTLTFTNLGFGDFRPADTVGQALTVVQTASGAVLLALLVFVLGRRAAR